MTDSKQVKDAAAQWIARRGGEHWTEVDEAELQRWLDASTANRVAFLRLEALWKETNRLKALGAGFKPGVVPSSADLREAHFFKHRMFDAHARSQPKTRRVAILSGAAASILLVLGLLGWHIDRLRGDAYSTALGVITAIAFPDGSKITLNTNSKMRVAMTADRRRASLQSGEAFFEIARDPARPFIVAAGAHRIVVLGTRFSVRHDGNELRVVVTEGEVSVEAAGEGAGASRAQLAAGNVARADGDGVVVQERTLTQAEELLSWRSGHIVFHETTLADAAAEFNRYNARKIVIADPQIAGIRISGNFRTTSVDSFARLLESGFPVGVQRQDDRIVLTYK